MSQKVTVHLPGNKIITLGQIHVSSNNLSSLLYLRSCSGWDGCSSFPIIRMFIQNVNCYVQCAHIPYLLSHFPRIERTIFQVHFRCLTWDFLLSLLFPVLICKKIWIQFLKWTCIKKILLFKFMAFMYYLRNMTSPVISPIIFNNLQKVEDLRLVASTELDDFQSLQNMTR